MSFLHGYNMEEDEETPLWAQNVFKKLWWAGLDRGFVAVQWRGNEGQTLLELPVLGYMTPNFYGNVQNAFQTAPALSNAMQGVQGPKWFIAHSPLKGCHHDCHHDYARRIYFGLREKDGVWYDNRTQNYKKGADSSR